MLDGSFHNRILDFRIDKIRRDAHFDMVESHYHPYYEIYYLLSGQCRVFINHSIYTLFPGDMVLIPPQILHKMLYETDQPAERITVSFTAEYSKNFRRSCDEASWNHIFSRPKLTIPTSSQTSLLPLLEQLLREARGLDAYSSIQTKALLFQLLALIGRCQDDSQAPQILDQAQTAIQEAARFIYEHYEENLTLADAALVAHMNTTYFSKKFKESTGFGFKEYLTNIRLQKAAQLLSATGISITEIAVICGFSDGNYFGDVFRKSFGVSPRNYRKTQTEREHHTPQCHLK